MQMMLNKLPLALVLAMSLSACITVNAPVSGTPNNQNAAPITSGNSHSGYKLASSHWTDVAKIRQEAQRLGAEVGANRMTKVQAAQYLNRYRLNLVGANQIDDNMYEVYQKSALDSQRGVITPEQSKAYIISALKGWQQRWNDMSRKPTNPAFTKFLMEVIDMKPLQ